MEKSKIGFVCFGEVNTPKEVLNRKAAEALSCLRGLGYDVVSTAVVTDDKRYADANRAVSELKKQEFSCLVVCIAGWIPTHAVIKVIDNFRHLPMLLWGLCGEKDGDKIVSTADQAGTTALKFAMKALKYRYKFVYNIIVKPAPVKEITDFITAAQTAAELRGARLGTMGYRDMLLYGTMFDGVTLREKIGIEAEPFEMLDITQRAEKIPKGRADEVVKKIKDTFVFEKPAPEDILLKSAKYALAVIDKINERDYKSISLIDVDGMKLLAGLPPALVFMIIDMLAKIPTIPENDILGSVTQQISKGLTGQISAYGEFYEFFEDSFLMGVPDFIPLEVVKGRPTLYPAAFGLLSTSVLNTSKIKDGLITLCRLVNYEGGYYMHLFKGTAEQPPKWEECGWEAPAPRLPSLKVKPDCGMKEFADKVASQHIIFTYGDNTEIIKDFCKLLDIKLW